MGNWAAITNDKTQNYANNHKQPWTPDEDQYIMENMNDMTVEEMAINLGRTYWATQTRKKILKLYTEAKDEIKKYQRIRNSNKRRTLGQTRFCHAMEVILEKEIRLIDPDNPVLIVYKDTFDAIDAYLAIK